MQTVETKIYNIANPAGFDLEIGHMQGVLSKLTFMDTIFGRAHLQEQPRSQEEINVLKVQQPNIKGQDLYTRRYPQGRKFDQDIDLTFADNYKSFAYFYVQDPVDTNKNDWTEYATQIWAEQPFSFMFFCNLNNLDCPSGEYLKTAILKQLGTMNNLKIGRWYESYKNVLKDFTITDNLIQICKYPNYALRIEAVSKYPVYHEGCGCINNFNENTLIDLTRTAVTDNPGQPNIN